MIQDEQKKYSGANVESSLAGQGADLEQKKQELEKMKQELAKMEQKLAEAKGVVEQGAEKEKGEAKQGEGTIGKEMQSAFSAPVSAPPPVVPPAPAIDSQNQVDMLCEMAFQKGLDSAIKAAQQLNNPYILDEFHDALVDKFYEKLISEKKIKEI